MNELFAPLRDQTPTDEEIAAVLAARRGPRRRQRGRVALALVTATAAAAVAIAALPERDASPLAPAGMLRAAAAAAADMPAFSGYRYTEVLERIRWGDDAVEQRLENWVDRRWQGHVTAHAGKVLSGRPPDFFYTADERAWVYGDGPLRDLDIAALPAEPQPLRRALEANFLRDFDPGYEPGQPTIDYHLTRSALLLLGTANTTPKLRSALWGVLALMPGLEPAPDARDPLGRGGDAVRLRMTPAAYGPTEVFTVVFDPGTSELLSWSLDGPGAHYPDQVHAFLRQGHVRQIGDRPR